MTAPKRRVSKARQANRRSHHRLTAPALIDCPHCHKPRLAHHVCPHCGYYRGKAVVEVEPAEAEASS